MSTDQRSIEAELQAAQDALEAREDSDGPEAGPGQGLSSKRCPRCNQFMLDIGHEAGDEYTHPKRWYICHGCQHTTCEVVGLPGKRPDPNPINNRRRYL